MALPPALLALPSAGAGAKQRAPWLRRGSLGSSMRPVSCVKIHDHLDAYTSAVAQALCSGQAASKHMSHLNPTGREDSH